MPSFSPPEPVSDRAAAAAQFDQTINWGAITATRWRPPTRAIPGMDLACIQHRGRPDRAHWPRVLGMCFAVPLEHSPADTGLPADPIYAQLRQSRIERWVHTMNRVGWELVATKWPRQTEAGVWQRVGPILVQPGPYPAHDLLQNQPRPGYREYQVKAQFRFRSPRQERIEVNPRWLEPIPMGGRPSGP